MKKHERIREIRWFLLFLASILFLGPLWDFFLFSKMDCFPEVHMENKILLFNFFSLDLTNVNIYLKYSKLNDF